VKIVHVNTYDIVGGAARAVHRLHTGLRRLNQDSTLLVAQRFGNDPRVAEVVRTNRMAVRLARFARKQVMQRSAARYAKSRPVGAAYFSDDRSALASDLIEQLPACDVLNLHWVAGFVDFQSFFRVAAQRRALVWTLHDANPFTGGCHYYGRCDRFLRGCGACPALGSGNGHDLSHAIWGRKKRAYSFLRETELHIVTPSRWLAGEVQKSTLLGKFPVSVIPNGLDTDVFRPRDQISARDMLGIPRDSKVVLFSADVLGEHRKGFAILVEALAALPPDKRILLVCIGRGAPPLSLQLPHVYLGFIDNDQILSWVYSAADLYVTPTLDDNLPNTVIEATSCGTPVVGFDTGGVPDVVRNGVSGFVVPKGEAGALREAVLRVVDAPALRTKLSENCRRISIEDYDLVVQARRYLDLYESIVR
jgi:glycosyltransferase involved in cell wall biosynthesis